MKKKMKLIAAGAFAAIAVFAALPVAFMQKNEHSIHSENATKDELVAVETAGYYNGSVDGVFGTGTRSAVILFQRKNGLTADGVVGKSTYKALGMNDAYNALQIPCRRNRARAVFPNRTSTCLRVPSMRKAGASRIRGRLPSVRW